jgi:hypothetical protein
VIVSRSNEYVFREYKWNRLVPTTAAKNWHCKYHISAD